MIRSTKTSIRFCNKQKKQDIFVFLSEYRRVCDLFIDILWGMSKIPTLMSKDITEQINSWLSAAVIQCAGKQASSIIKGVRQKDEQRKFIYNELSSRGKFSESKKLQKIIKKNTYSKPACRDIEPVLDSRIVRFDFISKTKEFDGWVGLFYMGNKTKINIPFKKTKHFNKLFL